MFFVAANDACYADINKKYHDMFDILPGKNAKGQSNLKQWKMR